MQLGGFIFGLLAGVIFLPYITFNYWHSTARVILICLSVTLLITAFSSLLAAFYIFQVHEFGAVSYFDCLPFLSELCHSNSSKLQWWNKWEEGRNAILTSSGPRITLAVWVLMLCIFGIEASSDTRVLKTDWLLWFMTAKIIMSRSANRIN